MHAYSIVMPELQRRERSQITEDTIKSSRLS